MKTKKTVLSVLALANVIFVPVFDVWGGLFPGRPDDGFFDVVRYVSDGQFGYWVVLFTVSIFVPSLLMLMFSFLDGCKLFKAAAGTGVVFMLLTLARFVNQCGWDYLYDFDDGNISIGTWIALALFIVSLIVVRSKDNKQFRPEPSYINSFGNTNSPGVAATPSAQPARARFCPECGSETDVTAIFCGKCGCRINK